MAPNSCMVQNVGINGLNFYLCDEWLVLVWLNFQCIKMRNIWTERSTVGGAEGCVQEARSLHLRLVSHLRQHYSTSGPSPQSECGGGVRILTNISFLTRNDSRFRFRAQI